MALIKAADITAPHAGATTNVPSGTFHELKVPPGEGVLMYWPEQNGFLALFPDEYRELYAEADEHSKKIEALQTANQKVTEASIVLRAAHKSGIVADIKKADSELETATNELQQASAEVKKKLEPLSKMDAKDGVKLVELVPLRKRKLVEKAVPIYVTSTQLKKILAENRIHLLSDEKRKPPEEKVWKDGKLDVKEIKKRIAAKVQNQGFNKEWKVKPDDADEYTGVLSEWARTMNGNTAMFLERYKDDVEKNFNIDPKDSRRHIDLSAEAQLLRYTAGAGLEVNFKPFQGNLNDRRDSTWYQRVKRGIKSGELAIKANAQASFAIAEGRIRTEMYLPHYAGWHASAAVGGQSFDLGYWRLYGDIIISGSVGASLAVELDVGLTYTGGKQGIRGVPAARKKKRVAKARANAAAELDVFAGARTGIDLTGSLQWLNPEGAESNGKPLNTKLDNAVAEYKDMATVSHGVGVGLGVGVNGAFKFGHEDGKFVIHVKLGACLGQGADATCKFEAGYETIGEFFKCLAYQLKRANFHMTDVIDAKAYETFCKVNYLVVAQGRELAEYATKTLGDINDEFFNTVETINNAINRGSQEAQDFMRRIRIELEKRTGSWLSYAPPEVLGKITGYIASARTSTNSTLKEGAPELMEMMLGAPQTVNHLNTIAERMTPIMGDKQNAAAGYSMMDACVAGTIYGTCVDQARQRLATAQAIASAPFLWNSEPEFVAARLAIEHPMYA